MSKIEIISFQKKIAVERILGSFTGQKNSPSFVVIAGIHGNESAGIYALNEVIQKIEDQNITLNVNLYAVSGNLKALQHNVRFNEVDLNRIWTQENIDYINTSPNGFNADVNEQIAIYEVIKDILSNDKGPFYFIDLHTTSAATIPFITISDSLNNRKFSSNFCLPIVLGIEEYLDGPLLTYINEFGHIALGFEGGQHDDPESAHNCEAFLWKALVTSGCVDSSSIKNFEYYENRLSKFNYRSNFYEIDERYLIEENEDFKMIEGFKNFEHIFKGQDLALSKGNKIKANMKGQIFMPLYQDQGIDGFFIITKISKFWLGLSTIVRKLKLHNLLRILPGIKKDPSNTYTLLVNPKTAKYLATEIFHLFGYRKQVIKDNKLHFIKRDRKISEFR